MLSTPLTVCLVVLGKHVPQFAFLEVLFGNEPVLDPKQRLYQRLLAGDPEEATDHAEEMLETEYLVDFYGSVAIPALLLGERDRARGALTDEQRRRVAASAATLVANLNEIANEEAEEGDDVATDDTEQDESPEDDELPDGAGKSVLCIGGRGDLDNAAAAMLAQVLTVQGASASTASHTDVDPANIRNLPLGTFQTAIVGFLNSDSVNHGRYVVRRLKRAGKNLRVGIVLWADEASGRDAEKLAAELNADLCRIRHDISRDGGAVGHACRSPQGAETHGQAPVFIPQQADGKAESASRLKPAGAGLLGWQPARGARLSAPPASAGAGRTGRCRSARRPGR